MGHRSNQYTPQPFSSFNPGQPYGSMPMGANPGWTPTPSPYGAHSMSPQYQVPIYGVHGSQQQMMISPGPTSSQMAQGDMNMRTIGPVRTTGNHSVSRINSSRRINSSSTTQQTRGPSRATPTQGSPSTGSRKMRSRGTSARSMCRA